VWVIAETPNCRRICKIVVTGSGTLSDPELPRRTIVSGRGYGLADSAKFTPLRERVNLAAVTAPNAASAAEVYPAAYW